MSLLEIISQIRRERLVRSMVAWWRQYNQVVVVILGVKAGLFLFSIVAFAFREELVASWTVGQFLTQVWTRWDAISYVSIVKHGYVVEGIQATLIAFLPLFPVLVRLLNTIIGNAEVSAMMVGNVASILGLYWFYRLAEYELGKTVAWRSLIALLVFPTAYFFNSGYTEGLFLWLSVMSFYAARRGSWWGAGVAGGMAALTKLQGVILLPALLWEFWRQYKQQKVSAPEVIWLVLIPGMFAVYLWLNNELFGTPWEFMEMQRTNWHRYLVWPWLGWHGAWTRMGEWPFTNYQIMFGWLEIGATLLAIVGSVWAWFKLRWMYAIFATLVTIQIMSSSFMYSNPRFLLSIWPVFLMLGYLGKYKSLAIVWLMWSVGLLVLLTGQFTRGWWAF